MTDRSGVAEIWTARLNWIRHRRSVRRFVDQPVPREVLVRILEAARWAPSAHNRQPWRFVVVEDVEPRMRLANRMGRRLMKDRLADGDPREDVERDVARSRERISKAPLIVLACTTMRDMDRYPDPRRSKAERLMAVQSTAMSVQNLLLAAHAEGVASCWMCAPVFCPDTVRSVLMLPADWEPQALVALGFPAGQARDKPRLPLSEIVFGWEGLP